MDRLPPVHRAGGLPTRRAVRRVDDERPARGRGGIGFPHVPGQGCRGAGQRSDRGPPAVAPARIRTYDQVAAVVSRPSAYAKRKPCSTVVDALSAPKLVDGWSATSRVRPTRATCWASAKIRDHRVAPVRPSRTVTKVPVDRDKSGEVNGRYGLAPTSAVKTTSATPSPVRSPWAKPRSARSAYGLLAS